MESKQERKAAEPDCFRRVRNTGRMVIVLSTVALFGNAMLYINTTPAIGEMGPFMHVWSVVCVGMSCWGILTGMGLLRRWTWSRISMLVFNGVLAICGAASAVVFGLMSRGDMMNWGLILFTVFSVLLALMIGLIGARGLIFFASKRVKTYFVQP